jgi:REP-associated tyrosine transposase
VSPANVKEMAEYIAQQETHHRIVSFREEYRKLLESHGIEYHERYVWD